MNSLSVATKHSRRETRLSTWAYLLASFVGVLAFAFLTTSAQSSPSPAPYSSPAERKPTVVLVHGAFAESSSWAGVISRLQSHGYEVVAAANPLRDVQGDARYIAQLVRSIDGPLLLVGHSYGGMVITAVAEVSDNVKGLVYVAAFMPEAGESAASLTGQYPGSTLASALAPPTSLPDGGKDLYIEQVKFGKQFAADVSPTQARILAAAQRPITAAALEGTVNKAMWRTIASWTIYGDADQNIPTAAFAFMAGRAKARKSVVVRGASHLVMVSHPDDVANLILEASSAVSRQP